MGEQALSYSLKRKTFGKRLVDHQVLSHKLADMMRMVESTQAILDLLTWEMQKGAVGATLEASVALAKLSATRTFELCAREAAQIFGGASYVTAAGQGALVERLYREVFAFALSCGSEEELCDLIGHAIVPEKARGAMSKIRASL